MGGDPESEQSHEAPARPDKQLWQTAPNGGWSSWSSLGQPSPNVKMFTPSVAANADGRLELFVTVQNGELYHLWQTAPNNGWSGWSSFAVPPGTTLGDWLAVAANADGRLEFFIEDFSGAWWNQWQTAPNNGWSGWSPVVGAPTTPEGVPSVAPNADGRLEFFIIDQSGALWHQAQTAPNNGWSNWASFGPAPQDWRAFRPRH
jgi:hypothetical protein